MLGLLLLTSVLCPGLAFPSYRKNVPNGYRVGCPPDVQGCRTGDTSQGEPASVCDGLGHATCAGADFPLNPFGEALKAADFKWTQDLCKADSDGDGFSNGEELGDPCCSWTDGDGPSPYMSSMNATHPGFATATLPSTYSKPACTAATQPGYKSPGMAMFNPGEEQRHVDFIIKNYSIPNIRTNYVDFVFNFDETEHPIYHIVYGIALVDRPKMLHHFVVTGCTQKIDPEMQGKPLQDGQPEFCNEPVGGFAGWAPGAIMWDMPSYAGVPIGTGARIVGFNINVHFTDGDIYPGSVSQDGARIYYTPTLRQQTVDSHSIMQIGSHWDMAIPAKKGRYFVTRTCDVQADHELPIVATFYHAHLLGNAMYQTLTRNNQTWDLGSQTRWHYDDQAVFPLLAQNLTVKHGDIIQATCIYDSMSRDTDTPMGIDTVDEMCFAQVNTARPTNEKWGFSCGGDVWAGDLGSEEDPRKIALLHPVADAKNRWYSTPDGHALGRFSEGAAKCNICDDPESFMPDVAMEYGGRNVTCQQMQMYLASSGLHGSQCRALRSQVDGTCCFESCGICTRSDQKLNESARAGEEDGVPYTCGEANLWLQHHGASVFGGCYQANVYFAHCCEMTTDDKGAEIWTAERCAAKINGDGIATVCPDVVAFAASSTPETISAATKEFCQPGACKTLVDELERNCAEVPAMEMAKDVLSKLHSMCPVPAPPVPTPAPVPSSESDVQAADGGTRIALLSGAMFMFAVSTLMFS